MSFTTLLACHRLHESYKWTTIFSADDSYNNLHAVIVAAFYYKPESRHFNFHSVCFFSNKGHFKAITRKSLIYIISHHSKLLLLNSSSSQLRGFSRIEVFLGIDFHEFFGGDDDVLILDRYKSCSS